MADGVTTPSADRFLPPYAWRDCFRTVGFAGVPSTDRREPRRAQWLSGHGGRMDYAPLERNGLLIVDRIGSLLDDPRSIRRDCERGRLVKLRRGAYVDRVAWDAASSRQQHVLRVRAVLAVAQRPITVAGLSAAAVWGMPIAGTWPMEVTILDQWRGGGRSEFGVRRTAAGFRTARVVEIDGMPVTTLPRTALDVAQGRSLSDAMGSVDWARWRKNERAVTKEMLSEELELFDSKVGRRHLENVINRSTSLSDSFGESEARVGIHLLGFEPPELQVELRDAEGKMFPDFAWLRHRKLAEFDGKIKYTCDAFTAGNPSEVVWKEKKREDRLRRMDFQVQRILTEDVKRPIRLERLLLELGVPRIATRGGR